MSSKFDKVSFVVSLIIVLPVTLGILWLDVMDGMWKIDLAAMVGTGALIILSIVAFWIGSRLRGKIHVSKEDLYLCLQGGMVSIVVDCALVVLVAFIVGYQPWLMSVLVPIFLLGVACLVLAALLRGSMRETM